MVIYEGRPHGRQLGVSRRRFIAGVLATVPLVLAACAGTAPNTPVATTKPASAAPPPAGPATSAATAPAKAVATPAAQAPANPAQTVLRMMFFHTQWATTFEQVIANFHTKNPAINVLFEAPATGNYINKVTLALAGGVGPDILSVNWDMVRVLSQKKQIADLTDLVKSDQQFAADLAAYHPKIQEMMSWNGKNYGVGLDHDDVVIFWNKTLFQKMGVPPPTDVALDKWDWNAVLDVAKKLTNKEDRQYGFYAYDLIGQTGYWSFVYANGGDVLTEDGSSADPLLKPEALEAIQWIADTRLKHQVGPTPEVMSGLSATSLSQLFPTGKLGMGVDGSWRVNAYVNQIKQFEWDVAPMPSAPRTGKRSSILHGTGFGVNRVTKNMDAANTFAKHLATKETHELYGQTGAIQSARRDTWDGFYKSTAPPPHRDVMQQAVEYAHLHPLTGQWNIVTYTATKPLENALQQIYTGKAPVQDAMKTGVAEFNRVLKEQVELTKQQTG